MASWNKEILRLAIPNIVTNITVPLLGMVDLAIVGHIGNESYIGGVSLGTMIFNLIYWNVSFLRAGTSGFAAQAYGTNDFCESLRILVRGVFIALAIALLLLLCQYPIAWLSAKCISGSADSVAMALNYFYVRIWACPATLSLFVLKGWFIGMQDSRTPMFVAIVLNIVNIVMGLLLVLVLGMGIEGVALGTVIAQYSGLAMMLFFLLKKYPGILRRIEVRESLKWNRMRRFFKVNADIFLRTICLSAVLTCIPYISARMGDMVLAANTLLMQLFTLFSYFMDGFAYAGEAFVGRFIGERNQYSINKSVRYLVLWSLVVTATFTLLYLFAGQWILELLTNNEKIIAVAMSFQKWTLLIPVVGFAAFLFDGIYVGATASRVMRNVMFVATAAFFAGYLLLCREMGNDGLWLAFLLFLALRGGLMALHSRKVLTINEK